MKVHDAIEQAYKNGYEAGKRDARKKGRWKFRKNWDFFVCSECSSESSKYSHYCPNCGAKMDGDGNE